MRSQRAEERAEGVLDTIQEIARIYGPKTLAEYVTVMNAECYTPSGRGKWSISLVHRYMRKRDWTPKSLREIFFGPRLDIVVDYAPHLHEKWRAAIGRAHGLSVENGTWIAAIKKDLTQSQTVHHRHLGFGHCVERLSLATYMCCFPNSHGEVPFDHTECGAVDLEGFEYFRSFEDRQKDLIKAQKEIFGGATKDVRGLVDGWHL